MPLFQNILVVVDTGAESQPVLDCAVRIATAQGAGLRIVDVVQDFSWAQRIMVPESQHLRELLIQEKSKQLKSLAAKLRRKNVVVKTKVLVGRSSVEIIRQAVRHKHDLVMKDAKGVLSRRQGWLGTTGIELLRKCPCAVWLFQKGPSYEPKHILAAVDVQSDEPEDRSLNGTILDTATQLQSMHHSHLDIVHVWNIYGESLVRDYMKTEEFRDLENSLQIERTEALNQLLTSRGLSTSSPNVHLVRGEPAVVIPQFTEQHQIDLIVMGTVGRSGLSGMFMGNTSEIILQQVRASILALKPAGWATPVRRKRTVGGS